MYAAQLLFKLPRTAEKDTFLKSLLDEIEIEKGLLNISCLDIMADMNQSVHFIRSFAMKVFSSADEEDRNGLADL